MVRPRSGVASSQSPDVNETAQIVLQALAANMGHQPRGPRGEIDDVVETFRRQKPPTFSGSTNPIQADNWIRETEMAFELMTCSETQKVICTTHAERKCYALVGLGQEATYDCWEPYDLDTILGDFQRQIFSFKSTKCKRGRVLTFEAR